MRWLPEPCDCERCILTAAMGELFRESCGAAHFMMWLAAMGSLAMLWGLCA